MKIDPQRSVDWLDNRIAKEQNPRHRAMIENYRTHLLSEVTGDMDSILATLVDEPVYHAYSSDSPQGERGPKNMTEVVAFYQTMFDARINVLERFVDRLIVTDDFLISEGHVDHVFPGNTLATRAFATDAAGEPIDPESYYLVSYTICAVLPYIGEGTDVRMAGEDTYTTALANVRRLRPEDVPDLLR
jgi:hypothetical protein